MTLERAKKTIGKNVVARDGQVGRVKDMVLDSVVWTVQVVVASTGRWLNVLDRAVPRQLIERVDADRLVVDALENDLVPFFEPEQRRSGSKGAEGSNGGSIAVADRRGDVADEGEYDEPGGDYRTLSNILGEPLATRDGRFGKVTDVIISTSNWHVQGVVVSTRSWLPGKRVLIPIQWVERTANDDQLYTPIGSDVIRNAPEYDPDEMRGLGWVERISRYYSDATGRR